MGKKEECLAMLNLKIVETLIKFRDTSNDPDAIEIAKEKILNLIKEAYESGKFENTCRKK